MLWQHGYTLQSIDGHIKLGDSTSNYSTELYSTSSLVLYIQHQHNTHAMPNGTKTINDPGVKTEYEVKDQPINVAEELWFSCVCNDDIEILHPV